MVSKPMLTLFVRRPSGAEFDEQCNLVDSSKVALLWIPTSQDIRCSCHADHTQVVLCVRMLANHSNDWGTAWELIASADLHWLLT